MPLPNYLVKRGASNTYYVRKRIPDDVRPILGKYEFMVSLRTNELSKARRMAPDYLARWEAQIEKARRVVNLFESDMNAAAKEHYRLELVADEVARAALPSRSEIDLEQSEANRQLCEMADKGELDLSNPLAVLNAKLDFPAFLDSVQYDAKNLEVRLAALKRDLVNRDTHLITYAVDEFLERHGLNLPRTSQEYRQLGLKMLRAEIEQLTRIQERNRGDYTGTPRDPLLTGEDADEFSTTTFDEIINNE